MVRFNPIILAALTGIAKETDWKEAAEKAVFTASKFPSKITQFSPCINGKAGRGVNSTYSCNNVNLHGFISHDDLGISANSFVAIRGNDVWVSASWRDIKVIGNYAYIGSEAAGHGLQIFDLTKLLDIKKSQNQYTREGLAYQSNYASGHRIVGFSGVAIDPTGGNFQEIGFFDVYPEDDNTPGAVAFLGTWSNYPYFKSRYILVNSIERGIFSVKHTGSRATL
ncbi:hypothetical protein BDZ85DRAFT_284656 [Elsinoe ampelina]|uniref:Uncharacterized protein n=1 Tax=Elsinoe ampelina TaxID=302913 RepID=A0A6A6G466_9PEZI|nr:hypothetical protein BDZ85DRAFT_284656 [Elsinoe ampelina]